MGRVIHTDSTGKNRNRLMRTCAELIRHLVTKTTVDDEARDMLARLIESLQEIDAGLEASAEAWEKRDYWMKAEQLRQRWAWVGLNASKLEHLIKTEDWQRVPDLLIKLLPHFADIKVTRFTRGPEEWAGAYKRVIGQMQK
ncbi:MAG: hypothetical protein Kow0077_24760 [Anaerolineae bacterium]